MAGSHPRTILANATNSGILRLFCAEHVVEGVEEHLAEWADQKPVDPDRAGHVWRTMLLPMLRCVDVPDALLTSAEAERIAALALIGGPPSDPDDVPTGGSGHEQVASGVFRRSMGFALSF